MVKEDDGGGEEAGEEEEEGFEVEEGAGGDVGGHGEGYGGSSAREKDPGCKHRWALVGLAKGGG